MKWDSATTDVISLVRFAAITIEDVQNIQNDENYNLRLGKREALKKWYF